MSTKEPRDFDFDRRYTCPAAWRKCKEALDGQFYVDLLFARLDRLARSEIGCPRQLLAFALHGYVSASKEERRRIMDDYWGWANVIIGHKPTKYTGPTMAGQRAIAEDRTSPFEELPESEMKALEADLQAIAEKLGPIDVPDTTVRHEDEMQGGE